MSGTPGEAAARPSPRGAAALAELSAELASGGGAGLEEALRRAGEEAGRTAVEEAILQSHLFLGFPAALEGLRAWRRLGGAADGAGARRPPEDGGGDPEAWEERGAEVCRRVYGAAYEDLRRNVRRLHPDMEAWVVRDGYGKVLGREGLDLATRELCVVAALAADGSPRAPLHSHLRGALRAGAGAGEVERALEAGLERSPGPERRREARELWRRVRARREDPGRGPETPGRSET